MKFTSTSYGKNIHLWSVQQRHQMVQLLDIKDVNEHSKGWCAIVTVELKKQPGQKAGSPHRDQKYIFSDSKGAKVEGVVFDESIELLSRKLQLFKKYKITNAKVKPLHAAYQKDDMTMQWTLSTRTPILEIKEEVKIDTSDYKYVTFDDLPKYMDDKDARVDMLAVAIEAESMKTVVSNGRPVQIRTFCVLDANMKTARLSLWNSFPTNEGQVIMDDLQNFPVILCRGLSVTYFDGLTMNTKTDSILLVNPDVKEASEMKNWAQKNSTTIKHLVAKKEYLADADVDFKINDPLNITPLVDVDSSQMNTWVKVTFNFKHIEQPYWYMACTKCYTITESLFEDEFNCNKCGEDKKAPRCRLYTDLVDDSDIIPATLFGDLAEKALNMKAVDVMNSKTEELQNHVASLQLEFDEKKLLVKIKPGKITRADLKQHYVVTFYSEAHSDTSGSDSTALNLQNKFNDASQGESSVTMSSKRPATEATQTPGDLKKEAVSEMTKRSRNKRN